MKPGAGKVSESEVPEALDLIYQKRFFDRLEEAVHNIDADTLLPWLDLLSTEAIEDWAYSSRAFKKVLSGRREHGQRVLKLLLKRKLFHLGTRRDPTNLCSFCEWVGISNLNSIWERLPATLEHPKIMAQESLFSERIVEAEDLSKRDLFETHWATQELTRLADTRRDTARVPTVRLVFAWTKRTIPELRPGLLVDFHLLGLAGSNPILTQREFFDDAFLAALDQIGARIGELQWRHLKHNCEIPLRQLSGASGAMALWVAHRLASPGKHFDGRPWSLPPWLVISSEIDTKRPHAPAAPVELVNEKAKVLEEEGIRQFWIAEGSCLPAYNIEDLTIRPFADDAHQLASHLFKQNQLIVGDFSSLDSDDAQSADEMLRKERERKRKEERSIPNSERLTPIYAFQAIAGGLSKLEGRGCLLVTGPSGHGKSQVVQSLARHAHRYGAHSNLGKVIAFPVLRGQSIAPKQFLDFIAKKAEQLDDLDTLDFDRAKNDPHALFVRRRICQLLSQTHDAVCEVGEPLLLIVDGIDELDQHNAAALLELLPRPNELSPGCFLILVAQDETPSEIRQHLEPFKHAADAGLYDQAKLTTDDAGYQSLLRDYASGRLGDECKSILPQVMSVTPSFRFLGLLCQWLLMLRDRGVEWDAMQLSEFPHANEIFARYLSELRKSIGVDRFDCWERRVLIMIATSYEPIDRDHLACWLQDLSKDVLDREHQIDLAIDRLLPLLQVERQSWLRARTQYAIADKRFADWLQSSDDSIWGASVREECARRVIDSGKHMLAEVDFQQFDPDQFPLLHYHFWYLPATMLAIGDYQAARQFLISEEYDRLVILMCEVAEGIFFPHELSLWSRRRKDFFELLEHGFTEESETGIDCIRRFYDYHATYLRALMEAGRYKQAKQELAACSPNYGKTALIRDILQGCRFLLLGAEISIANGERDAGFINLEKVSDILYRVLTDASQLLSRSTFDSNVVGGCLEMLSRTSRMFANLQPDAEYWLSGSACAYSLVSTFGVLQSSSHEEERKGIVRKHGAIIAEAHYDWARMLLAYASLRNEIDTKLQQIKTSDPDYFTPAELAQPIRHAIAQCDEALRGTITTRLHSEILITRGRCRRFEGHDDLSKQDFSDAFDLLTAAARESKVARDGLDCLRAQLELCQECVRAFGPDVENNDDLPWMVSTMISVSYVVAVLKTIEPDELSYDCSVEVLTDWLNHAVREAELPIPDQVEIHWQQARQFIAEISANQ